MLVWISRPSSPRGPVEGSQDADARRGDREAMRALIVDGDRDLIDVMTYSLRRDGYDVVAAINGQQALERLHADHPDIVLLELRLGRPDGFEVCRRIRLESEVPIIVVSSSREEDDVLRALRLGAD